MPRQQNHHESKFLRPRADVSRMSPIHQDRIIVKRLQWPDTERGLHVPEIARQTVGNQLGEVVAIGPGRTYTTNLSTGSVKYFPDGFRDTFEVKVGDKIVYARSPTNEIETGDWGIATLLYEEQSVICVLTEDGTPRPLYDRIVVNRIAQQANIGRVAIPGNSVMESNEGIVLSVGGGRRLQNGAVIPLDLVAGDRVLFGEYAGTSIRLNGEDFLILREYEVFGVRQAAA